MSSINQLISEIAHSVQQADSVPVRRAIRLGIIHARNELIRKSYSNHNYTDKVLKQRFRLSLIDVPDGDLEGTLDLPLERIKRTKVKVPRPTRLDNGMPFHSIRTSGVINPISIPFVGEGVAKYYRYLPGMECSPTYDYINEYVYIQNIDNSIGSIIIESVFEYPHIIPTETVDGGVINVPIDDDDEFLLPEDMIGAVKKLVLETFNVEIVRDTNEIANPNLVK